MDMGWEVEGAVLCAMWEWEGRSVCFLAVLVS